MAQLVKNPPAMGKTRVQSLGWEDPLEKEKLLTPVFWPGDPMDFIVLGVTKRQTQLSDCDFHIHTQSIKESY